MLVAVPGSSRSSSRSAAEIVASEIVAKLRERLGTVDGQKALHDAAARAHNRARDLEQRTQLDRSFLSRRVTF